MRGRTIRLSAPRRLMAEVMHFARKVPGISVEKRIDVTALQAALAKCHERPRWTSIVAKAFAIAATEMPELRQAYLTLPVPHLYEYPSSSVSIAIERIIDGEPAILTFLIKDPAALPLGEISRQIDHAKTAPLSDIKQFRKLLRIARLPRLLRRGLFSLGFNWGRQRANYFGTFSLSSFGSFGASGLTLLSPVTPLIHYGPIDNGWIDLRGVFDHRVMDGACMARTLVRIDEILNGALVREIEKAGA